MSVDNVVALNVAPASAVGPFYLSRFHGPRLAKSADGDAKISHYVTAVESLALPSLSAVGMAIENCTGQQAFGIGWLKGASAGATTQLKKVKEAETEIGAKARGKKFFEFEKGRAGFLFLDLDGDYRGRLEIVCPWLLTVGRIWRRSSGRKGWHCFIPVRDMSMIPEFTRRIFAACWIAGEGWIELAKDGSMLVRALIDQAVAKPERLVFEANKVGDDVARPCEVIDGPWLEDVPDIKDAAFRVEVSAAKEALRGKSQEAKASHHGLLLSMGYSKEDIARVEKTARVIDDMPVFDLYGGHVIWLDRERSVTVQDILKSPSEFMGDGRVYCQDPIEPEYQDWAPGKAVISFYQGRGQIRSWAHGGRLYELKLSAENVGSLAREARDKEGEIKSLLVHIAVDDDGYEAAAEVVAKSTGLSKKVVEEIWTDVERGRDWLGYDDAMAEHVIKAVDGIWVSCVDERHGLWEFVDGLGWKSVPSTYGLYGVLAREAMMSGDDDVVETYRKVSTQNRVVDKILKGISVFSYEYFDNQTSLLGLPGGVYDFATGEFRPYMSEDRVRTRIGVDPDWSCDWSRLRSVIMGICEGDKEKFEFFMWTCAYALRGVNPHAWCVFIYGPPGSGKTTLVKIMEGLFKGAAYTADEALTNGRDARFSIIRIKGKRLLLFKEASELKIVDTLKAVSGRDVLSGEIKGSSTEVQFQPIAIPVVVGNELNKKQKFDSAMIERMRVLLLENKFRGTTAAMTDGERDELIEKEAPGLMAAVFDYVRLYELGIKYDTPYEMTGEAAVGQITTSIEVGDDTDGVMALLEQVEPEMVDGAYNGVSTEMVAFRYNALHADKQLTWVNVHAMMKRIGLKKAVGVRVRYESPDGSVRVKQADKESGKVMADTDKQRNKNEKTGNRYVFIDVKLKPAMATVDALKMPKS